MADKTASMQPSTTFHDTTSPITHSDTDSFTSTNSYSRTSINSIVHGVPQLNNIMERKNQFDITASLMSPPEATPLESFARTSPPKFAMVDGQMKSLFPGGMLPMSPPVSPATKNITTEEAPALVVRDPILYPHAEPQSSPSSRSPLFGDHALQRVVDEHVAAREPSLFREASPPKQDEYELVLEFKSQVAKAYNASPMRWLDRERAYLLEDRALKSGAKRYTNIAPASGGRRPTGPRTYGNGTPVKVSKTSRTPNPKPIRASPDRSSGPKVAREDKDFNALPDYCPPVDSLPNKPNSLKVDWRGAPITLTNDPHYHLLHPDEILLAANLRLDCATYLTSKRRIFIKRIEALKIGKEFRKTDAQQACKIDVNKASKLWQAFEKVGWLNPAWVRKYL